MNPKLFMPLIIATSATSMPPVVSANDDQTFANVNYLSWDVQGAPNENDGYQISGQHYFSAKDNLGPLGEFEYINKDSNVYGRYSDVEDYSATTIGGEYFNGNFLIGGGHHSDDDDFDSNMFSIGYLFNENILQ